MKIRNMIITMACVLLLSGLASAAPVTVDIQQITHGPRHHFFGYIGHVRTIPWNASGRYILALRTDFQERMPGAKDAADVMLIDTQNNYTAEKIEESRGWNFQQGTMFYWNPDVAETQFFFNDRDPETGKVFCVLYDISTRKRVKEYRFEDTPVGNSGVMQGGGHFMAINYARLARLRPVTGYPDAWDWTEGVVHPFDDGIFKVNIKTGEKTLIASYAQIAAKLRPSRPDVDQRALFINHTLCNRDDDRVYFFARGDFRQPDKINHPFTMNTYGGALTLHEQHIGGHPEWAEGHHMLGNVDGAQAVYDTDTKKVVGALGDRKIFPNPEGDIALSPDGTWFVNGNKRGDKIYYTFYRMADGLVVKGGPMEIGEFRKGELRIDPGPDWNREGNAILVPGLGDDGTRQLFVLRLKGMDE